MAVRVLQNPKKRRQLALNSRYSAYNDIKHWRSWKYKIFDIFPFKKSLKTINQLSQLCFLLISQTFVSIKCQKNREKLHFYCKFPKDI